MHYIETFEEIRTSRRSTGTGAASVAVANASARIAEDFMFNNNSEQTWIRKAYWRDNDISLCAWLLWFRSSQLEATYMHGASLTHVLVADGLQIHNAFGGVPTSLLG